MKLPLPISYSGITAFENCPKQFHAVKLLKLYKFEPTEAMTYGIQTHLAIETAIVKGKRLPKKLKYVQPILDILNQDSNDESIICRAEWKVACDRAWRPVPFWSERAFVRGVIDFIRIDTTTGVCTIVDWKTGRRWLNKGQLTLYATILMSAIPWLKRVDAMYVWLKNKKVDSFHVHREQLTTHRNHFEKRIEFIAKNVELENFPAWTGPLCAYCPLQLECEEGIKYLDARRKS